MAYFNDCTTAEELKKAYHRAAAKLHPDNGGDAEQFKAMQAEYTAAFDRLKDTHKTATGETYKKATKETAAEFMGIINQIIHMQGVKVEIIGAWVWISGNTMLYKDQLKAAGFWWSKTKKAWYWNGSKEYSGRRGNFTMSQLRTRWGSMEVETEEQRKIS